MPVQVIALFQRQGQLFGLRKYRRSFEWIVQPTPQITVSKQVESQHRGQIGQRPFRLRQMVQPFQQQHGDQGCPNLDAERVLARAHETLHLQILLQRLERLNDILPINNALPKLPFTIAFIRCARIACQ